MREGSLFTGAGGGLYGSRLLGWRTKFMVEQDTYCQRVLRARQVDGWFDECPIHDDVFAFDGTPWRGEIDVLSAGFPCQPFSVAGARRAGDDPRNGWPHTLRIIREIRPALCWLENVPGLVSGAHGYFGEVLGGLHEAGYDAVWAVVGAADAGAPHKRDRLWILAYLPDAYRDLLRAQQIPDRRGCGALELERLGEQGHVAHAHSQRELQQGGPPSRVHPHPYGQRRQKLHMPSVAGDAWQRPWVSDPSEASRPNQSFVDRVADGVADRGNRLRALGNGQVAQSMVVAFRALSAIATQHVCGGEP